MLKRWNQYGSETDVFDKYRKAVRKSNRASIRIFGMAGIVITDGAERDFEDLFRAADIAMFFPRPGAATTPCFIPGTC